MQLDGNTNEVLQMLYILLTDKIHFQDLSDKNKFQKDKEWFGVDGLSLFNFLFSLIFDRIPTMC